MAQNKTLRRWSALLAASILGVTLVVFQGTGSAQEPSCGGTPATLVGTESDDLLNGTTGPDVIVGLGGHDVIFGFEGNDVSHCSTDCWLR